MVLSVYNPIKGTSRTNIICKKWGEFFSNPRDIRATGIIFKALPEISGMTMLGFLGCLTPVSACALLFLSPYKSVKLYNKLQLCFILVCPELFCVDVKSLDFSWVVEHVFNPSRGTLLGKAKATKQKTLENQNQTKQPK